MVHGCSPIISIHYFYFSLDDSSKNYQIVNGYSPVISANIFIALFYLSQDDSSKICLIVHSCSPDLSTNFSIGSFDLSQDYYSSKNPQIVHG